MEQLYYAGKKHRSRSTRRSKNKFFKSRPFGSRFGSRRSSLTSHDNSSTSQVLPAITIDPNNLFDKKKVKSSLHQVAPPGKSIDVGSRPRHSHNPDRDDLGFKALEEKLRHLAEASRTSHETFLPDENVKNVATTSAQTSLTDLSNLGKRPGNFIFIYRYS